MFVLSYREPGYDDNDHEVIDVFEKIEDVFLKINELSSYGEAYRRMCQEVSYQNRGTLNYFIKNNEKHLKRESTYSVVLAVVDEIMLSYSGYGDSDIKPPTRDKFKNLFETGIGYLIDCLWVEDNRHFKKITLPRPTKYYEREYFSVDEKELVHS
jgi:hypothetical protein